MNYDLLTWFEYFIGAFTCCLGSYFLSKIWLNKKMPCSKLHIISLSLLTILTIVNSLVFDSIIKVLGVLLIIFCINHFIYKEKSTASFTLTFLTYIVMIIGEVTFALLASIIVFIFNVDIMSGVVNSYIVNILIMIFSIIYAFIFKKLIRKIILSISEKNLLYIFLLGTITALVCFSSIYNLFLNKLVIDYTFILNLIIVIGCSILTLIMLREYLKNKEIRDKYQLLEEYLKTSAELIEKYSTTNHKYKNNLISIKGYMKSDIEEAKKFVDGLLDNYKNEKYIWFTKINYINFDSVRYLVYYKLSRAEEENLNIFVNVDKDIQKINGNLMNIHQASGVLDILGEFFDNSIYASQESQEKEMIFNIYFENKKMVFEISNTYLNNVDLNLISKNGYTTKGKGHGFGLYEIDKNIKSYPFLEHKYEIVKNYFITKLYISIDNLEVKKK